MLTVRNRKRQTPPAVPQQQSLFEREFSGEQRLAHELFRRGLPARFLDGLSTPESRRARLRMELAGIAEEAALSQPGVTLRQLFEQSYREAL